MFRLLLRPILLLTLLAALPIALIRAQPYDDSDLRAFLTPPEGCPAPCFMGIRPGVTTLDEAIAILEAHDWVQSITVATDYNFVLIEWKSTAPAPIDPFSPAQLRIQNNVVGDMDIKTTHPIWAMYLLEGQPQATDSDMSRLGVGVSAYYFMQSVRAYSFLSCPVTQTKFWDSVMYVSFGDLRGATGFSNIDYVC